MRYAAENGIRGLTASSAGTHAVIGHRVHEQAAAVLEEFGADTAGFAARQLTAKIARPVDLILTMTRAHRDIVLELVPSKLNRTFTLAEASRLVDRHDASTIAELASLRPQLEADQALDVEDPIGQRSEVFRMVGTHIAELLLPVVRLCRP
ncbi:protein-tyrosine-phosphatase [Mycobacterium sp. SMC-8]|uniref:arsenate reductase/protein-tyrosine-phosphatase family protein n=1 Tax=Mycobacterium sp. SMC-8 TaxID=2857060 RepID=UPI0021B3626F|nr:protein-tyrosine-phosphatase [Mycobacterium sp. SMC-8]